MSPKPPASFWRDQASVYDKPERAPEWMEKAMDSTPRKQPAKRKDDEARLQIQICQYLNTQPRILYWANPGSTWVGTPTPAKLGYLAKLKRMGAKKGVPDLALFFRSKNGQPTLCMAELKSDTGRVSDEQLSFMESCNERGGFTSVVRSLDDLMNLLKVAGY